jgi:hypothetical protein
MTAPMPSVRVCVNLDMSKEKALSLNGDMQREGVIGSRRSLPSWYVSRQM